MALDDHRGRGGCARDRGDASFSGACSEAGREESDSRGPEKACGAWLGQWLSASQLERVRVFAALGLCNVDADDSASPERGSDRGQVGWGDGLKNRSQLLVRP